MNSAVVKLAEALANPGRGRGTARAPLKEFGKHPRTDAEIKLMEGRFGPYVTDGTTNATVPKSISPNELTLEEAAQLIDARAAMPPKGKVKKKAAPKKKAAAKKAPAKAKAKAKAKT
jgi:DNA topoisomerase-1